MPELHIKNTFQLGFSPAEFNLILRALRGITVAGEEKQKAAELAEILVKAKVTNIKRSLDELAKLEENLAK